MELAKVWIAQLTLELQLYTPEYTMIAKQTILAHLGVIGIRGQ